MSFEPGPLQLPCGARFSSETDAWTHYETCAKCHKAHAKRGFYGEESQKLRFKAKKSRP